MITASHNTKEWNGCKLCRAGAVPISGATGIKDIERMVADGVGGEPPQGAGSVTKVDVSADYAAHVREFAQYLGKTITVGDVTDREGSKLFDPEVLKPLTLTCLAPKGVIDAAWLELGMLSKSRAKAVGGNEISYEEI